MSERSSRRTILQSHKAMSQNKPIELQLERDLQLCRILGKCCKDRGITPGYVRVLAVVIFKVSLYYWGGGCACFEGREYEAEIVNRPFQAIA